MRKSLREEIKEKFQDHVYHEHMVYYKGDFYTAKELLEMIMYYLDVEVKRVPQSMKLVKKEKK